MKKSIAFIGAGNVAWHLAPALDNIGYAVKEVFSRSRSNSSALVKKLYSAEVITITEFDHISADIIIISVPDDAIEEVADQISVPENKIIVHTSGAKPIDLLSYRFSKTGVFYPLQTFSKSKKVDFKDIPILIEGSDRNTEKELFTIARPLSANVKAVSSSDRRYVHLAAVFACNFSNHMLSMAEDILKEKNLDLKLLYPLISETMNKALVMGPKPAQTGPAKRHDLKTLDQHLAMLENNSELAEIYRLLSQHIIDEY